MNGALVFLLSPCQLPLEALVDIVLNIQLESHVSHVTIASVDVNLPVRTRSYEHSVPIRVWR